MRNKGTKVLLSFALGAIFLFLAFRGVPLAELWEAIRRLDRGWLLVALVLSLILQLLRTLRWQLELKPLTHVPFSRLWVVTSVAYMAINLLPVRLGEVVRPWLLARRSGVNFANVVGNLVIEKTLDSLVILFYVLVGLATAANLPDWVRRGATVPAFIALLLIVLVWLLWWKGETFLDRWLFLRLPEKPARVLRRVVGSVVDGMRILPSPRLLGAVVLLSVALWFVPILSSYVVIRAFALDLPFSAAVIVFIFIGFGTALPNPPGMIGPFQYACILALSDVFGVDKPTALAYGLVLNAIQLFTLVAQGVVALPFAGVHWRDVTDLKRQSAMKGH